MLYIDVSHLGCMKMPLMLLMLLNSTFKEVAQSDLPVTQFILEFGRDRRSDAKKHDLN